jgi:GNAT superfamily N-acetyltransferase
VGVADDIITPCFRTPHDIAQAEIHAICALKNQSWPHSIESQLAWWDKNTAGDDVFVTLVRDRSILAFLRLRNRTVTVSGIVKEALCVTEVCVDEQHRGRGLGKLLLDVAATHIKSTCPGLAYLLCWDTQAAFYYTCGWRRFTPLQIKSSNERANRSLAENERCMVFDPQNRLSGQIVLFGDVF